MDESEKAAREIVLDVLADVDLMLTEEAQRLRDVAANYERGGSSHLALSFAVRADHLELMAQRIFKELEPDG